MGNVENMGLSGNFQTKSWWRMKDTSWLLFVWLMETYFITLARFVLFRLGVVDSLLGNVVLIVVASIPLILLVLDIRQLKPSQYLPGLLLLAAVGVIFGLTAVFHPEYKHFFLKPQYGIDRILRPDCAVYAFLFFSMVNDPDDLLEVVRKYAILDGIYILIVQLTPRLINGYFEDVSPSGETMQFSYSLSFGYATLLPTFIFLYIYFTERKIWYLLTGIFGCILIFLFGNRGALLMIGVFVGLLFIGNVIDSHRQARRYKLVVVVLALVFLWLIKDVLLYVVNDLFRMFGVESRTLDLLMAGKIADDNGRDAIWAAVIEGIKEGGLFGYGVLGDRQFVEPLHYAGYSHNIFLEMISNFGILGVLIIGILLIGAFRMIFFCKDRRWRGLFIIFFSISCQLLLSMSYWYVMEFWAAIAIAYRYYSMNKRYRTVDIAYSSGNLS